ncbi:MAG: PDZ domain-containing protein [Chloroflexi bacterium CFX7]|nr:PDZ domain-containing protein [Chloroflexi bacterium CFX7]
MDFPRQERVEPGIAERATRGAVVVFLLLALMLLAFALGWGVKDLRTDDAAPKASASADGGSSQAGSSSTSAVVDEICSVLRAQHVDGALITDEMCREAAINGVVTSLNDPHTAYITPEEMEGPGLDMGSTYQGIGASVSDATGQVQIVAPFRDSPAEKAGIRPGDIVLEVDGDLTDGWSDSEAVKRIRGKAGTPVTLKVKHTDGTTETSRASTPSRTWRSSPARAGRCWSTATARKPRTSPTSRFRSSTTTPSTSCARPRRDLKGRGTRG